MKAEDKNLLYNFLPGALFAAIMWLVFILSRISEVNLASFGVFPRKFSGLPGIVFSPFLHGDLAHLLSNTFPIILLSGFILLWQRRQALPVFFWIYLISGLFTWFVARPAYHIGASGIVYGLASFLFMAGILNRSRSSMAVSAIIIFLYGSMVYGLFPNEERISWEGHLGGVIAGVILAFIYRAPAVAREPDRAAAASVNWDNFTPAAGPMLYKKLIEKPHPYWPHVTTYTYYYVVHPKPDEDEDDQLPANTDAG